MKFQITNNKTISNVYVHIYCNIKRIIKSHNKQYHNNRLYLLGLGYHGKKRQRESVLKDGKI